MIGRQIALPARSGRAAIVRIANGAGDSVSFAYSYLLVVLEPERWSLSSRVELLHQGYFHEDFHRPGDREVRIARLEDVDEDGEAELFVVLQTDTESICPFGHCSERRVFILDFIPQLTVQARIHSVIECPNGGQDTMEGAVVFRDLNGDGHPDLLHRSTTTTWDFESDPQGRRTVSPPVITHHLWDPESDRYIQTPEAPGHR